MYLRDETDLWGFIQNNEYEPHETELVKKIVKPDMNVLDIGANVGFYTILMSKLGAYVTAYEPEPSNYGMLELNVRINKLDHVQTFDWAIGDGVGNEDLYLCNASHGMHRMFKSKFCDNSIKVNKYYLDSNKMRYDDFGLGFIKIDVEGSEYQVLNGAIELIEEHHPQMLIEFHPPTLEEAGTKPQDVYDFLIKRDYKIELVWPNKPIQNYEQLDKLTRNESGGQNIWCH